MKIFSCPYLDNHVELTDEREQHIAQNHPDFLPEHQDCIIDVLAEPDQIYRSPRFNNARLFSRWFESVRNGKYVVIVVVSDPVPQERHWIITAYIARRLAKGRDIEWERT